MRNIILVGLGGFIGSIGRYLISGWLQDVSKNSSFPWGTITVNVIGCFAIGLIGGLADNAELLKPATRVFVLMGILGGFTTYSSFGYETLALVRNRETFQAMMYVSGHLVLGLVAVWIGYGLSTLKG